MPCRRRAWFAQAATRRLVLAATRARSAERGATSSPRSGAGVPKERACGGEVRTIKTKAAPKAAPIQRETPRVNTGGEVIATFFWVREVRDL